MQEVSGSIPLGSTKLPLVTFLAIAIRSGARVTDNSQLGKETIIHLFDLVGGPFARHGVGITMHPGQRPWLQSNAFRTLFGKGSLAVPLRLLRFRRYTGGSSPLGLIFPVQG